MSTTNENKIVLEKMRERWPKAADWNVDDDDHAQILDKKDRILVVITCNDLTCIWNACGM
jgi:hypothetical protein